MRRLEEIFWPTKGQAIRRTIGWTVLAFGVPILCSSLSGDSGWWSYFWFFAVPAAYCALVLWYKVSRDQKIGAHQVAQRYTPAADQGFGTAAPKTTPGSGRIFLPDPLRPPESV